MNKFQKLWESYTSSEISLVDFQARLRPVLGDYPSRSIEDDEFINSVVNEIELIIYTIPKEKQNKKVLAMFSKINEYVAKKESES